jgi:hypothetical protein
MTKSGPCSMQFAGAAKCPSLPNVILRAIGPLFLILPIGCDKLDGPHNRDAGLRAFMTPVQGMTYFQEICLTEYPDFENIGQILASNEYVVQQEMGDMIHSFYSSGVAYGLRPAECALVFETEATREELLQVVRTIIPEITQIGSELLGTMTVGNDIMSFSLALANNGREYAALRIQSKEARERWSY